MQSITANIVDVKNKKIFYGQLYWQNGIITEIKDIGIEKLGEPYLMPGFIDAHIHIESSMLAPSYFAQEAVKHGTVATISDPHEIANVCGLAGVQWMLDNAAQTPFKFFFGAPSCVPATGFETAGANLGLAETETLLANKNIWYLSEMMNYPGVIYEQAEVIGKLQLAKKYKKPIDGHAPAVRGVDAEKYFSQGISTDHECITYDEAKEKINLGVNIIIREGSAAKNYEALKALIDEHPNQIFFCSDDKHPDDLVQGHINKLVARAIADGFNIWNVLQAACINPILHYKIPVGYLQLNQLADFIVVNNLTTFNIQQTYINGQPLWNGETTLIKDVSINPINNFNIDHINLNQLQYPINTISPPIIEALDGQLITNALYESIKTNNGFYESDTEKDILKMVVVNRYQNAKPAIAFIKNFGLRMGALASTVAHDCHNIIAVGTSDEALLKVINALIDAQGGVAVTHDSQVDIMPLPIAGLMSMQNAQTTAKNYERLHNKALALGSKLKAPFMTLSFMALLVIPELKLSDKGLFNGKQFAFV
jgi:adenine deaminase